MKRVEAVSTKLSELKAIATFNQTGKVGGLEVTPVTAKAILSFYDKLESVDLKKKFLFFDAKQMKSISLGIQEQKGGIQLTPEGKALLTFGKHAVNGANIVWSRIKTELNKKGKESEKSKL